MKTPPGSRPPHDRRDSYRLEVREGEAWIEAPDWPDAVFRDLSASGGSLLVRGYRAAEPPHNSMVRVHLGSLPPFRSRLVPVRCAPSARGLRLGVRLEHIPRNGLQALSHFLADRFMEMESVGATWSARSDLKVRVVDSRAVAQLLVRHGLVSGRTVAVRCQGQSRPVRLRITAVGEPSSSPRIVADVVSGDGRCLEAGRGHLFMLPGANGLNCFEAKVTRADPDRVVLSMPEAIVQSGFRDSDRFTLPDGLGLGVTLSHLGRQRDLQVRRIIDVSARGMAALVDRDRDILFPGEVVRGIRVNLPAGEVAATATIRSLAPASSDSVLRCGLELMEFEDQAQAELWQRFVFAAVHPGLLLGSPEDVPTCLAVLRDSGYLEDTIEERRLERVSSFVSTWTRHTRNQDLGRFFIAMRDCSAVGTLAGSLLYPGTWLIHHLGVDATRRQSRGALFDVAREMYAGIIHLFQHLTDTEHFILFVDADKMWNELMYGRFLQLHSWPVDSVYDEYIVLRGTSSWQRNAEDAAIDVVPQTPELLQRLAEHLEATLPRVEVDAMALGRDSIGLEEFEADCAAYNYRRERRIFFALNGDDVVAALIAEAGDDGANIFGVFDRCWMVAFEDPLEPTGAVVRALARAARHHYFMIGKADFLLLGDISWPRDSIDLNGFTYQAKGVRWISRRHVLPAYLNYVENALGLVPRPLAGHCDGRER